MTATLIQSAIIPAERLPPGIRELRGIAAVVIVLFHLIHLAVIDVPKAFFFIAADFCKGVHLFIILSAYAQMHSTTPTMNRSTCVTEYIVKRHFRIAPLFCPNLAGVVLWPLLKAHRISVNLLYLALNWTFTIGLAPWTSIVWAG